VRRIEVARDVTRLLVTGASRKQPLTERVQFTRRHAWLCRIKHPLKNQGNDASDALQGDNVILCFDGHGGAPPTKRTV
jgi:hypothetical protein